VPHVSADAPTSGFVNEYVVVVVSAITNYPNGFSVVLTMLHPPYGDELDSVDHCLASEATTFQPPDGKLADKSDH